MFERLVESNTSDADLKPRRKFFFVSSVIVGILFVTAVIASIYAADFDLGNDNFDLAQLLTPIAETEPATEPEPRRQPQNSQSTTSDRPERQILMASTSDPSRVPPVVSTAVNPYMSTSPDKYADIRIGRRDIDGPAYVGVPTGTGGSSSGPPRGDDDEIEKKDLPPAPPRVDVPKRPVSIGVANGIAISLPKPPYPPAAIAVHAKGAVSVQVTIDEQGKVISAKAASGHILLRQVAEQAAWKARFTPTKLSNVPVKVTGVIVYNFTR